jgi:iron complex transport system ATP-binding protein
VSLRLDGVCVDIAGRRIVSDIDLRVQDGCFAGLLGPNGSGKSTILKAIYRVHQPSAGRVLLDGLDLPSIPAREAARRLAVVIQESTVEFAVTVHEMVMLGRIPHKRAFEADSDEDREIAADALARVGCTPLAGRSFHTLSGGEKQRVLIARALAQGADHLILDEPTNHLDIRYQVEVLELVADLGVTVLAAIHDLGLAALYCDTVHLLNNGRLVADGPPAEVITREAIQAVYDVDVAVIAHPDTGAPQLLPRRRIVPGGGPPTPTERTPPT